jgi:hypothetical protein
VLPLPEDGCYVLIETRKQIYETISKGGQCNAMVFLEVQLQWPAPVIRINSGFVDYCY